MPKIYALKKHLLQQHQEEEARNKNNFGENRELRIGKNGNPPSPPNTSNPNSSTGLSSPSNLSYSTSHDSISSPSSSSPENGSCSRRNSSSSPEISPPTNKFANKQFSPQFPNFGHYFLGIKDQPLALCTKKGKKKFLHFNYKATIRCSGLPIQG